MQKRKQLPEDLRPFFPLLGMTVDEGQAWLKEALIRSPAYPPADAPPRAAKEITVCGRPVELQALESFTVQIEPPGGGEYVAVFEPGREPRVEKAKPETFAVRWLRVIVMDGAGLPCFANYDPCRINVKVADGKIIELAGIY